jgi:hypothetical protein
MIARAVTGLAVLAVAVFAAVVSFAHIESLALVNGQSACSPLSFRRAGAVAPGRPAPDARRPGPGPGRSVGPAVDHGSARGHDAGTGGVMN